MQKPTVAYKNKEFFDNEQYGELWGSGKSQDK